MPGIVPHLSARPLAYMRGEIFFAGNELAKNDITVGWLVLEILGIESKKSSKNSRA